MDLKLRPNIIQKMTRLGLVGYVRRNLKHPAQDFASFCSQTIRGSFPASLSGVVGLVPKVGLLLRLSQILSSAACTFPTSTPVNSKLRWLTCSRYIHAPVAARVAATSTPAST